MKKCRYCKSEIDSKAKICPNCRKSQTNPFTRAILIIAGIILVIIGISSLGKDISSSNDANSNKCVITMEKFNSIQNGMTYNQVKDIIGCDGTLNTEASSNGQTMKVYYWYASNGISNGTFSFMNDVLDGKSQVGL